MNIFTKSLFRTPTNNVFNKEQELNLTDHQLTAKQDGPEFK